jgi:hypothetical protein
MLKVSVPGDDRVHRHRVMNDKVNCPANHHFDIFPNETDLVFFATSRILDHTSCCKDARQPG